ncbi:MAG: DUF362 domain-containing protein [Candidatus Hodarchaeales archaeon]|jgi:uncharacterized Fe-S center protein
MSPSKVYYGSIAHGVAARFASFASKVDKIVENLDLSTIDKKDKVCIKMHLGFNDGYQTIPVFFVRRIVQAIKKFSKNVFITDNPTAVFNAVDRGYTQETCGCPIIPIAGVKDNYTVEQKINYRNVDTLDMAGVLNDADVLVNLTHAKGHNSCGYGGAIKNIALGGYSRSTRWNKIHGIEGSISYWDADKCSPEHAKKLVESCSYKRIKYDEEKHKLSLAFGMCCQCMECLEADKNVGCLHFGQENFSAFQELMAVSSKQVLDSFEENKQFYINFLLQITAMCDCWGIGMPSIVNDIGVLGSRDIVAIEMATLDLIKKEGLIDNKVPLYFKHANLDPSVDLHPFQRLNGHYKNPYITVEYAEKLNLGVRDYDLIEILSPEETMKTEPPKGVVEKAPSFF